MPSSGSNLSRKPESRCERDCDSQVPARRIRGSFAGYSTKEVYQSNDRDGLTLHGYITLFVLLSICILERIFHPLKLEYLSDSCIAGMNDTSSLLPDTCNSDDLHSGLTKISNVLVPGISCHGRVCTTLLGYTVRKVQRMLTLCPQRHLFPPEPKDRSRLV